MTRGDFYDSPWGAAYSTYMERPRLSSRISRLVWGGDIKPYYESMATAGEVPDGGKIIDCPCGAGPALRAIPAERAVRYLGVDLSPSMLRRARKRAAARELTNAEFVEADATAIPSASASADLWLSYWGLHCFADPQAALAEAARVLKPGSRLVGSSFVRGRDSLRQRFLIRPYIGDFGPLGTQPEIESWFADAGLELTGVKRSGPMLFFDARKRAQSAFAG
ncbi:MAG TPA: methyltransferase domain-containing protein [Solirubrobacterales bacterium]